MRINSDRSVSGTLLGNLLSEDLYAEWWTVLKWILRRQGVRCMELGEDHTQWCGFGIGGVKYWGLLSA
jgi:hypothetical protein